MRNQTKEGWSGSSWKWAQQAFGGLQGSKVMSSLEMESLEWKEVSVRPAEASTVRENVFSSWPSMWSGWQVVKSLA